MLNRWTEVKDQCNSICDSELFSGVKDAVIASKERSTTRNYSSYFRKFVAWCSVFSFSSLPATPVTVALYLVSIIQRKDSRCGKSKLNQIFYSISWAHKLNELNNSCTDVWLKLCLQGCIRKVSLTVIKKEPITISILTAMVSRFATENCYLGDLRIVTLFLVAFAAFFPY